MSLEIQVLGKPGEDNATLFRIDSGSSIDRLLFDCGEKCIYDLANSEIHSIDHVFFSHFHMDHICGFDSFFRHNYNRPDQPVTLWGPPGIIEVIENRLRGYTWNLHHNQPGEWIVNELDEAGQLTTAKFYTREAFKPSKTETRQVDLDSVLRDDFYTVSAHFLCHGSIPSLAWRVIEPEKENFDPSKLKDIGIKPGPWLKEVKDSDASTIEIEGETWQMSELREKLLVKSPGQSAAYLTDFILDPESTEWQQVCQWLAGIGTLVCEAQYSEADYQLAVANSHMTTHRVARLAKDCKVEQLIIQHVSRRYDSQQWLEMLAEAKAVFADTSFPENWKL